MPRKAAVSVVEAVQSLKKFIDHFATSELPVYTSTVWKEISQDLQQKWTPHHVYNSVVQDRRGILTLARSEKGVVVPSPTNKISPESDDPTLNESTRSEVSDNSDESHVNNEQQLFEVQLTREEWDAIKPKISCSGSEESTLQKGVWTNTIAIAISRQTKIPCAYVFKRAKVSRAAINKFVKISGRCKAKSCGNEIKAYIEEDPKNRESVILKVLTNDTRNKTHEFVKRPLNGSYRKDVQKDLVHEGASNFRKRKAREEMSLGDAEPPYLPNAVVLRRAKKARVDEDLGLGTLNSNDLNSSIEEISERPEFCGKIEFIASTPFLVVYRTPSQLHAYKEYCKRNINSTIMIDATGSLVKKMVRNNKTRCGPIFLYSMVINYDKLTVPVHQMLSEKHDARTIIVWIHCFLRAGAPKPKRAVCDHSKALLYALCKEFNDMSLKKYVQYCFEQLLKNEPLEVPTLLHIDVAHNMNAVSKWKCWKAIAHVEVKQFFLRCVGLMIQSSNITLFRTLLMYTMTVAAQKYLDTVVKVTVEREKKEIPSSKTVLEIRNELEKSITKNVATGKRVGIDTAEPTEHLRPIDDLDDYVKSESDSGEIKSIVKWVDEIRATATAAEIEGREMNAFFVPGFIPLLRDLALDFPIWTNCTTPDSNESASSAAIESHFNDIKTNVLGKGLRRADNFLITHLRDIEGGSLLFVAHAARHENVDQVYEEADVHNVSSFCEIDQQNPVIVETDSDPWSLENWRNQVPRSEFVNPTTFDTDEVSNEEGNEQITWDHSYSRNEKEPEQAMLWEDEITNKTSNVVQPEENGNMKQKGIYLRSCPEIRYINRRIDAKPDTTRRKMKPFFLENGSKLQQPVKINGKCYFVESTCAFDSIVQILLSGAVDHPSYDAAIKNSTNAILRFVVETLTTGVTKKTYMERARLLLNWYTPKPKVQTVNKTVSYALSAYDSIYNFLNLAMKTEPSLHIFEECTRSCKREYSLVVMSPNHRIIQKFGYSALENALNFWPQLTKLPCFNKDCPGKMTRINRLGVHLLIDADVRVCTTDLHGVRSNLENFPTVLKLKDDEENEVLYRLIGIVAYMANHFTGYSFRNMKKWECSNDLEQNTTPASAKTDVLPHLILYIRTTEL